MKAKRVLSVLLTVCMLLSLMTSFGVAPVNAAGLAADYPQLFDSGNSAYGNTMVINPSWDLSSATAGSTALSFTFRGETVNEVYNASRHFSSYDDAWAAWEARYTSGGDLQTAIATAVPNFILAPGTYSGDITVRYSANIYGAYADMTPNDPSYSTATALPTDSWGVNPARGGSSGETVISGKILRSNMNAGSTTDTKYDAPLKSAGVTAYTLNINGVKFTGTTAVLSKDLAYNVGAARTNNIYVSNAIFSGCNYGMSADGDSSRNFNKYYLSDIRVTGMVSTSNGSLIRKYPNTVSITRMNFEGNAAGVWIGGTASNTNDYWWTSCGGARGVSFTIDSSRFAENTTNILFMFRDNSYLPSLNITFTDNVFKNAQTNTWGVVRLDTFAGSGYPKPQVTMTGNTFYGEASKNYHALFNGNQDYQKAAYNITFNGNRVIGYGSPFPNLTSQMDSWLAGCVWDFEDNYFASSFTSASDEAGVAPVFYSNGASVIPVDLDAINYYFDYNKTTSVSDLRITGANFESQVHFFNVSESNSAISAMVPEDTAVTGAVFTAAAALANTAIYADSGRTTPVTSFSYSELEAAGGSKVYYVVVSYGSHERVYTFTATAETDSIDFATGWNDPNGVIANTAALVTTQALAAGSPAIMAWGDTLYSFTMGTNAFNTVAQARAAGKTQVLFGSENYGDIVIDGPVEIYGQGYAQSPNTVPAAPTDDRDPAWTFITAKVNNITVSSAATPSSAAGTAIVMKGFELQGRFNDTARSASDYPTRVTFDKMLFAFNGTAPTGATYYFNNANSNTSKTSGTNCDEFTVSDSRFTFVNTSGYFRLFAERQAATVNVDNNYFGNFPTLGWVKWTNGVSTGRYNVTNNYFKDFDRSSGTPNQVVSFSGMADQCDSTGKDVRGAFTGNILIDCFNKTVNAGTQYFACQLYPGAYRHIAIEDNTFIDTGNSLGYIVRVYSSTYSNNTSNFADAISFTGNRVLGLAPYIDVNSSTATLTEKDGNYYARYTDDFATASGDCRFYSVLAGGDCYVDYGKTALNSEMAMVIDRPLSMVNADRREASFVIGASETYVPHIASVNGTGFIFYEDEDCSNSVASFSAANVGEGRMFYAKAISASGAYVVYKVYVTVGNTAAAAPAAIGSITDPYLYYIETSEMPVGTKFTHTWKGTDYVFTAGVTAFPSIAQIITAHENAGKSGTPNVILPAGVYQDKMVVTKTVNIYGENAGTVLTSAPDTASAIKIACVGDSITEGHGISASIRPTSAYPAQLQTKLNNTYGAGKYEVKNFGWGGSTINVQSNRETVSYTYWTYIYMVQYYESLDYNPDIVIIMMGHNDTHGNFYTTAEQYKQQYQALIDSYEALPSHPTVVVAGCTSRTASMRRDLLLATIIPIQQELARENGLIYVDMFTPTNGKEGDTSLFTDGLHCTVAGYGMLADLIKEGISPILSASRSVTTDSVAVDATQAVAPASKIKVACIGDSLTYGDKAYKGYPIVLGELLGDAYEVRNLGCCGTIATDNSTYTGGTDWSYKTYVASQDRSTDRYNYSLEWQPDIVIMMLGYNDAGGHLTDNHSVNWTGGLSSTAAAEFKKDYKALIQEYIDLGAEVYVATPPCTNNASDKNGTSAQKLYIDPIIEQIAGELGIPFINTYERTKTWSADMYCGTNNAGTTTDNTHMSDKGYAALANVMFEEVFGTFADNYVDDLGEIENTAMVLDMNNPSYSAGTSVTYNWEGKNWRFTWGVNAFSNINDILNRATALGQHEVQALLVENGVITGNFAGDFNLLYTDPSITSIEVFGINRRFDPNDKSATSTDPTADWTLNSKWDSYAQTAGKTSALCRIILNCNSNNNNVILAGLLKFKGVTMRNIIWNSERARATAADPRNLDLVFENCVVDFTGVTTSGGYLYNGNGPRNNSSNSAFSCGDRLTFKNFRIEKYLYKNNRIFATYSDPFVTLDGFYYNGDRNYNGSSRMSLGMFGWLQTSPGDLASAVTITNSNFRNDNFTFNCAPIDNNVVAAGKPTPYTITNNVFVNSTATGGFIVSFAKYYTAYTVENNYFIQSNSNPVFGINSSHTATDVNYVNTIGYSVKNNTFVLADTTKYSGVVLNGSTSPDLTGSYVASYTSDYATAIKGIAPAYGHNDYYYLDFARTVKNTDMVITGMGVEADADSFTVSGNTVTVATTGGVTLTDTSVTTGSSKITSAVYSDSGCTAPASEFVLPAAAAYVDYYVKLSFGDVSKVYTVRFELGDAPMFAADYVDPNGVIDKSAIALVPSVSGNSAGDIVTVLWQGLPYRFTVGVNAFPSPSAISSAKGNTDSLQIIFPAGTYAGTFTIYGPWKIYGEGYAVNPNLIEGDSATLNPAWSANGVSLINNGNVIVGSTVTPATAAGAEVLIAGIRMNRYINDAQRTASQYKTVFKIENCVYERCNLPAGEREFNVQSANNRSSDTSLNNKDEFIIHNLFYINPNPSSSNALFVELCSPITTIDGLCMPENPTTIGYPKVAKSACGNAVFTMKNCFIKGIAPSNSRFVFAVSFSGMNDAVTDAQRADYPVKLNIQDNTFINCGNEEPGGDSRRYVVEIFPKSFSEINITGNKVVSETDGDYNFINWNSISYSLNNADFTDRITFENNRLIGVMAAVKVNELTNVDLSDNYFAKYTSSYAAGTGDIPADTDADYYLDYGMTVKVSDLIPTGGFTGLTSIPGADTVYGYATKGNVTLALTGPATYEYFSDEALSTSVSLVRVVAGRTNLVYVRATYGGFTRTLRLYVIGLDDASAVPAASDPASVDGIASPAVWYPTVYGAPNGIKIRTTYNGTLYEFTTGQRVVSSSGELGNYKGEILLPDNITTWNTPATAGLSIHSAVNAKLTRQTSRKMQIACVGDSITEGAQSSNASLYSYPVQLQNKLGTTAFTVGNFGKSAATVQTLNTSAERGYTTFAATQYNNSLSFLPDVVIFALGTNDTYAGRWKSNAEYVNAYIDLIKTYQALSSKPAIYITTALARADNVMMNERVKDNLRDLQKHVAQVTGAKVIDTYTEMLPYLDGTTTYFADNLHPNDTGYGILAQFIADEITANIPESGDFKVDGMKITLNSSDAPVRGFTSVLFNECTFLSGTTPVTDVTLGHVFNASAFYSDAGRTAAVTSVDLTPYADVDVTVYTADASLRFTAEGGKIIAPATLNGVSLADNDTVNVNAGTAPVIDLSALLANSYGNVIALYADDMLSVPADMSAADVGNRGSVYYMTVTSPDGVSETKTVTVNIAHDSVLTVGINKAEDPVQSGEKVTLSWRGFIEAHGSYTVEIDLANDGAGFSDGTRRVGIIYTSTNDAAEVNDAKAAVAAAAQSADFDAALAAYNGTATHSRLYAMASSRQLYWNDTVGAWTYRYNFNVAQGKTRAAVAFVVYENDNHEIQTAFSDVSTQIANVG